MNAVKRGITVLLFMLVMIMGATGLTFAKEGPVTLKLNGIVVQTEVPPVMESNRTLIPARAFFEAMGGTVSWDKAREVVEVRLGMDTVQLTIGSRQAQVNSMEKTLDVPARIIQNRTMIPVRFVSECIGCTVGWDNATRTVSVATSAQPEEPATPVEPEKPVEPAIPETEITSISVAEKENYYRVTVKADKKLGDYTTSNHTNPKRFSVDIKDAMYAKNSGQINADNQVFSSVRYSQYDKSTVRIVIDLNLNISGKVSKSSDGASLYIDFSKPEETPGTSNPATNPNLPRLDSRMADKLIVIDPGHGGDDPGALGKVNGKVVLNEKDVNLKVSLRLRELLEAAGAKVDMTRYTDTTIALRSRPETANNMNAELFVSIHNNSNTSSAPNGTEVLYFSKPSESGYNIKSKELAEAIQKEMAVEVGLYNRGARQVTDLVVMKYSTMPAVIVEGAFISNDSDRAYMMTDEYVERYATAVARAIIKVMNAHAGD